MTARHRIAGAAALAILGAAAILLAASGPAFVPGTDAGSPRWLLGPYGDGFGIGGGAYLATLWTAFAAYLAVVVCARALGPRVVRRAIVAGLVLFALAPPLLSLDVFSYISYARLGAVHGLSPYDYVPAAVPSDPAYHWVTWPDYKSPYGPLFTVGSYAVAPLSVPAAMWTLKAVEALAVLAIAALVARLAAVRGIAPAPAAALVALNPLVLVHVVGGGHNDGLMVLALLGGVAMVTVGREAGAGASLVAAFAVKATAYVAAPFAFLGAGSGPRRARLVAGALVALAALAAAALAAFGSSALDWLSFLSGSQQRVSYHSVPATAARFTGIDLDAIRIAFQVAYVGFAVWLLAWTARGGDWVRAAAWATLGLLCATVYLTPWYLLWALPLAALARDRAIVALTLALCAYQLSVGVPG